MADVKSEETFENSADHNMYLSNPRILDYNCSKENISSTLSSYDESKYSKKDVETCDKELQFAPEVMFLGTSFEKQEEAVSVETNIAKVTCTTNESASTTKLFLTDWNQKLDMSLNNLEKPTNTNINLNKEDNSSLSNTSPSLQLTDVCYKLNENVIELLQKFGNRLNIIESTSNSDYVLNSLVEAYVNDNSDIVDDSATKSNKAKLEGSSQANRSFYFNFTEYDLYYQLYKEDPNYVVQLKNVDKPHLSSSSSSDQSDHVTITADTQSQICLDSDSLSNAQKNFWAGCDVIQNFKLYPLNPISLGAKQQTPAVQEISEKLQEQPTKIIYNDRMMLPKRNFLRNVNNYLSESLTTMLQSIETSLEKCSERLRKDVSVKTICFGVTNFCIDEAQDLLNDLVCDWYKIINNLTANIIAILEEGLKFPEIKLFLLPGCSNQAKFVAFYSLTIKLLNEIYGIYNEIQLLSVLNTFKHYNSVRESSESDQLEEVVADEDSYEVTETPSNIEHEKCLYNDLNSDLFIYLTPSSVSNSSESATSTISNESVSSAEDTETSSGDKDVCSNHDEEELVFYIEDLN